MTATLDHAAVEPNNAVAAAADERLKHAYRQIASADEQLARVTEQLSKLERDAAHRPLAAHSAEPPRGRSALRGFAGLMLAAGIVGAAFVLQSSWGGAARLMIARWVPQPALASSVPLEQPQPQAPPGPLQVAAAEAPTVPAGSPASAAQQGVALPAAPISPELAQLLQTITQDIANLDQKLDQLKATQAQVADDNAKAIEEIKAGQEQVTRLVTRISEQNARPKALPSSSAPTPSPRPIAITPRQPASAHASAQARSSPAAMQPPPQDQ